MLDLTHAVRSTPAEYMPVHITRMGEASLARSGQTIRVDGSYVLALVDGPVAKDEPLGIEFPGQCYLAEVTACTPMRDAFEVSLVLILKGQEPCTQIY